MPKAVRITTVETVQLKSAPPDGYVKLVRMSYGDAVQRRAMMKLSFETGGGNKKDFKGEMAMASVDVQLFEFANSITDHNLEDENGNKLNLGTRSGLTALDSKVGQEIEKAIADLNNFNDDDDEESSGNSQAAVKPS